MPVRQAQLAQVPGDFRWAALRQARDDRFVHLHSEARPLGHGRTAFDDLNALTGRILLVLVVEIDRMGRRGQHGRQVQRQRLGQGAPG